MSANPLLSIEGLTASVDEKTILHNVSLNVAAGETHVLMGPNGAGKTTAMRMLCGLSYPTSGSGTVAGLDVMTQGEQF